jgi:hypothetical protein
MVYFVKDSDNGRIKIGTTIRLSERLRELARDAGGELQVLAVVSGGQPEEALLHRRFSHLRIVNEWFEPGDDLLGFIGAEGMPWRAEDDHRLGSVKLRIEVIEAARIVAAYRNESMTDMLSDLLAPLLAKMEREEVAKRTKEGKGAK